MGQGVCPEPKASFWVHPCESRIDPCANWIDVGSRDRARCADPAADRSASQYQGIRRRFAALADGCAHAVPLCGD
jgi:hypothetical protein